MGCTGGVGGYGLCAGAAEGAKALEEKGSVLWPGLVGANAAVAGEEENGSLAPNASNGEVVPLLPFEVELAEGRLPHGSELTNGSASAFPAGRARVVAPATGFGGGIFPVGLL